MSTPNKLYQGNVLRKISVYLTALERDNSFIKQFEEGYCSGISSLWLYSKWLQTQPNPKNKDRDDYSWFKSTRDMIANWDGDIKSLDKNKKRSDFERFISQTQFFQHVIDYFPTIRHGNIDQSLEDTVGREEGDAREKRKLRREYSIASLFTLEQLTELLNTENIVQKGKLILITSHNHDVALFRKGDDYYYFDPNSTVGEIKLSSLDEVEESIFRSNIFDNLKPSPLGFRVFSFDEAPKLKYPSQQKILTKISPTLNAQQGYANNDSGLTMAARIGCLESMRYFLRKGVDPNIKMGGGWTALEASYI